MNIAIVDDEQQVRDTLKTYLAQLVLIVVLSFLTVEKTIVQEQELIAKRKAGR